MTWNSVVFLIVVLSGISLSNDALWVALLFAVIVR